MIPVRLAKVRAAVLTVLAVFGVAAGCAQSPDTHDADQHPRADQALVAFHDLMEPLWQAPPGPEVNGRACAATDEIIARAKATVRGPSPSPEQGALISAAGSLRQACGERDEAAISTELVRLHALFHRLAGGRS